MFAAIAWAQVPKPADPPEEDESAIPKEYSFNPLQASKELQVGNFYLKKGSLVAAAGRFEEATRWNPQLAEAYYRLAETREKIAAGIKGEAAAEKRSLEMDSAKKAYEKFVEVAPEDKRAAAIRKKLAAWKP